MARWFLMTAVLLYAVQLSAQLTITAAFCENKINPSGILPDHPRFSWNMKANENDQYQTANQLVVASSAVQLEQEKYDMYNSGKITSAQSLMVAYKGKPLLPACTYYWRVRVWDKKGIASGWSPVQQFTTALTATAGWYGAKWIGYEELPNSMRVAPGVHAPFARRLEQKCIQRTTIPFFRKQFMVDKPVKSALLFITGLGQYEASINGIKTGNAFLAPGWTYFDKTVLYNTYDITSQLVKGPNAIGVLVGNGFYNINRERYFKLVAAFGTPRMLCRLKIVYTDGSTTNIVSDESWRTAPSPISFTSIYGGEDYDAQAEQNNWNTAAFNDAAWKQALLVKPPAGKLQPEQDYPVQVADSFTVQRILKPAPGIYVYDFGQNSSGILRLTVKGKKGSTIKLVPAELLTEQHLVNQRASGQLYSLSYTLKGEGEETWQPRFSYYGFRYVQVEGAVPDTAAAPGEPVMIQLKALHTRNANPANGTFVCADTLFNRIFTLINWAIKSNMQSVLTDCPHREKLSWLEQDYLMGASVHYNFDIYHLYRKLVRDLIDAQYAKGFVPDIAPEYVVFDGGFLDSPEWGSAAVILPWLLYEWYGDKNIVQQAYPMMKKYLAYLGSKASNHLLSHGLGDWFDYGPKPPGEAQLTPKAVTATCIYHYDAMLLSRMAGLLGYSNDQQQYRQLAAAIKRSFNSRYFNAATGVYATGSQTAMAMPLCTGLVEDAGRKKILQNLVDSIYAHNKALTAGDIGYHFLVKALEEGGASQLIYDMNNRDDVPGYGYQLKKGATALTESWPALEEVSNNHLMLGHIMEWFYTGLAGIAQQDNSVAFKHIRIRPQPVGNITSAAGRFHSPYGWISSSWKKQDGCFLLHVEIPVNTDASIYLPAHLSATITCNGKQVDTAKTQHTDGSTIVTAGSGVYDFEVKE